MRGSYGGSTLHQGNRAGGGFRSAKAKISPCGLSFLPIHSDQSANPRGSACREIGVVVEAVVCSVGLIEWGVAKPQTEPARVRFLSGV
jgi:hypothetical protein